jgi:hypothetical protein
MDDIYHVLNATYCDMYATAEAGQKEYASLLLSGWTRLQSTMGAHRWRTGFRPSEERARFRLQFHPLFRPPLSRWSRRSS